MGVSDFGFAGGFIRAIAELADDPERQEEVYCGLLALDVVDAVRRLRASQLRKLNAAKRAIKSLSNLPLRRRLRDIVLIGDLRLEGWPYPGASSLFEYGRSLADDGHYYLAIDVLGVLSTCEFIHFGIRLLALQKRAMAARLAARYDRQWDFAEDAYRVFERSARGAHNTHMALEAQLGLARVEFGRGNIGAAEAALYRTMAAAERCDDRAVLASAHTDLAQIAGVEGRPLDVIEHAAKAVIDIDSHAGRDRMLQNIAEAMNDLGKAECAREIALWVLERAQEKACRDEARELLGRMDRRRAESVLERPTPADLRRLAPIEEALSSLLGDSGPRTVGADVPTIPTDVPRPTVVP